MRDFLASVDGGRAVEHAAWLTRNAPYRQGGSEREHRAAEYVAGQLEACGFQVQMHEFMGYMGFPGEGRLEVLSPEAAEIPLSVFAQSTATPPEGVDTELVYCGHGGEDDYRGKDVRGKVVLTHLSFTPPRPEKARLAAVHGAAGILMMHFLSGDYDNLPEGSVKALWGNPTDRDFHLMQAVVPSGGLRRADGERLLRMLERGPVRVRLTVRAERRWTKLKMPVGYLPGNGEPDRFTLVGGHLCSWSGGATDNAAGDGAALELARAASLHRDRLRRGVMVAFWPAHEQGIMEGSTWFVDTLWDRLDQHCTLYLNLDEMGKRGTTLLRAHCSPEAAALAVQSARDAVGLDSIPTRPLPKAGDQSFFGIGVPSVWVGSGPDEETLRAWQGAEYGWWWHTRSDTMERLDPDVLQRELQVNAAVLWRLSTSPVLPFRFRGLADRVVARLDELQAAAGEHLDLSAPLAWARRLRELAAALDAASEAGRDTNQAQMELSRALTHATSSVAGRWAQDSYGLSDLKTFLPGLRAAADLPSLAGTDAYHLVLNRLLRERNRVRDAIRQAARLVEASGALG